MNKKRTYFPRTTGQQRRLLFEEWEASGDRDEACRKARVARSTFYHWKPRFEAGGYEALAEAFSHAPHHPHRASSAVEEEIVKLRQEHPEWGKRRMADELSKGNNWVPLASPNTVKRILEEAGLWPAAESGAKKRGSKPSPAQRKRPDRR